jgi:hypothetical protein
MIDHETEELIPFEVSGNYIPGRPSRPTLFRWTFKGVKGGHKLESILVGTKRFTSKEAISRFIASQNAGGNHTPRITPSQRRKMAEAADSVCKAKGF